MGLRPAPRLALFLRPSLSPTLLLTLTLTLTLTPTLTLTLTLTLTRWAAWVGEISLDLILPVGCDRPLKPYERLVVEGMVPVLLILLVVALTVGWGAILHLWGQDED